MYHYELIGAVLDAQVVDSFGIVRNTEVAVRWETGHRDDLVHEALVPHEFPTCGPDADVAGLCRLDVDILFALNCRLILCKLDDFLVEHVSSVNPVTFCVSFDFRTLFGALLDRVVRVLVAIIVIVT